MKKLISYSLCPDPSCSTGKAIHLSKQAAEAHIRSLYKLDKDIEDTCIYRCPICSNWHVGRMGTKRHRNKYLK